MNSPDISTHDGLENEASSNPKWQPIGAIDRRVLGVLVEKAKTTPDAYPLSPNALKNGCNQKSNRFPQMNLDEDDIEDAMERLRLVGAAVVIQGGHRIDKMRHLAYEWLGVDKSEVAVMAELLLRGAQSFGDLRARAARMEPIPGLAELRPIVARLVEKKLIVYLTPPGRGSIVTHNLYRVPEMEKLQREHGGGVSQPAPPPESTSNDQRLQETDRLIAHPSIPSSSDTDGDTALRMAALENEIERLREEMAAAKMDMAEFRSETQASIETVRADLEELNRALGNL